MLLDDGIELQPARAFTPAWVFAAADPEVGRAVDPARVLIASRDASSFARHFFLIQQQLAVRFELS